MKTMKERLAEERIANARRQKKNRRNQFILRLANRRELDIDQFPCQNNHSQLVSEVVEAGNGYFYKAKACSGCPQGREFIDRGGNLEQLRDNEVKGCFLVREKWLFSEEEVSPNDIVIAKDLKTG